MSEVIVKVSGPIFNGKATREVGEFLKAARHDVSQQGFANWMTNLNESIRFPTPYYETQVNVRHEASEDVVNDRAIVYGWWLEKGAANPAVDFRGYKSRFRAWLKLEDQATELAERRLPEFVRRMQ